jgi:hypothetical protein
MALAESEDRKKVPDGTDVPHEIALRQTRLIALDEAKRKIEAVRKNATCKRRLNTRPR